MSLVDIMLNSDLEVEQLICDPQADLRDIVSDIFENNDPKMTIRNIIETGL